LGKGGRLFKIRQNPVAVEWQQGFYVGRNRKIKEAYDPVRKRELRKQLALILCLVMIFSVVNPFFVMAEEAHVFEELDPEEEFVMKSVYGAEANETDAINVQLSIQGIENTILEKKMIQINRDENQPTALDVLEKGLQAEDISYELIDYGPSFGIMVVSIGEDAAGIFGGYDGWMYRVNDVSPEVAASAYTVKDDDDVYFYYNRWPALSSDTVIEIDDPDPEINLHLVGDEFSTLASSTDNWTIDLGKTGLTLNELIINQKKHSIENAANATITLTGTAKSGIITIAANADALGGSSNSNVIQILIEQQIDIPLTDHDWVKNGQSVLDALLKYHQADGSFWWTQEADGGLKWPTVDALDALVNLSFGGSAIHKTGKEFSLDVTNRQLKFAVNNTINWYQQNYPAPDHWRGISALRNSGQNLNIEPWQTTQPWRSSGPGFTAEASGNEHVHAIFKLLAVNMKPEEAWNDRNLFNELVAQQNNHTGSFGDLGRHIWAITALDTGKNLDKDIPNWNDESQKAALLHLIKQQNTNGSFGSFSELDFSGWALVALSNSRGITVESHSVDDVVNKALMFLSSRQKENAGFDMEGEWGEENASSNAAVVAGLAAVGETLLPQENTVQIENSEAPLNISIKKGAAPTRIIAATSEENGTKTVTLPPIRVEADSPQGTIQLDFPGGTKVTGPADWDGSLLLPRWLHQSSLLIEDGNIHFVMETGLTGASLSFDQPVRLTIPGQKNKSVGFIQQGILTEITNELWWDGDDSLYGADIGKINVADDLVIWTTHFTTFVAYDKTETMPPSGGGGGGGTPGSDSKASLAVRGYQNQIILPSTQSSVATNETVKTFTEKVLANQGISYDFTGGYLRMINGLSEFDKGPESGWVFSINGSYPQTGASSVKVYPHDEIEWKYTTELLPGTAKPVLITATQLSADLNLEQARTEAIAWILDQRDFNNLDNFTDWDSMVLARNGVPVPDAYLKALGSLLEERDGSFRLVTDYARIILATTALGIHAEDVFGYNLLGALLNHENMLLQGVNGPAHTLLALDAYDYLVPEGALWNREKLIEEMIRLQKRHGGYSLSEKSDAPGDIDLTAMVLQALAPYKQQKNVKPVVDKALSWLWMQTFDNTESIAQTILALAAQGQDAAEKTFENLQKTLLHELMKYQKADGGFSHHKGGETSEIATQQALMALTAYHRFAKGEPTFFEMRDVTLNNIPRGDNQLEESLEDRLKQMNLADENQVSTWALEWVKKAVAYGLMSGVSTEELRFDPKRELTRAEFAVLMAKLHEADMSLDETAVFQDILPGSWYFGYVMTARNNGWMSGVGEDVFVPNRSISRQEMAVVLAKALMLTAENEVAQPADLDEAAEWAKSHVGLVYHHRLMVGDGQRFMPRSAVTREMAAVIMVKLYEDHLKP
jgi:hypothetical protein